MSHLDERTADQTRSTKAGGGTGCCLALVFQAEAPLAQSVHWPLADVVEITIGRDLRGGASVTADGCIHVGIADRFASERHVRLQRAYGSWILQDEGSHNGTFVGGKPVERCTLPDGAIIEIGRSFFVYREGAPVSVAGLPDGLQTLNPHFSRQIRALTQVAVSPHPIVLRGETGTGKEVVARAVHNLSTRAGPFQAVNCAALPQSIAEAELFGYRKGAFSGALDDRPGLIRAAHGGTLFLDEIGDLPLPMQGLLLRALQESEVTPVGSTKAVPVDFRLLSATHRDLEQMVAAGTFRSDLFSRIEGFTLRVPALRDRVEDLGMLIASLLRRHAPRSGSDVRVSLSAARTLFHHAWRLNVRELEKVLSVALTLSEGKRIELSHLPPSVTGAAPVNSPEPPRALSADAPRRREELDALLREHKGNISAIARALGKARTQVHRWLERYGLNPENYR